MVRPQAVRPEQADPAAGPADAQVGGPVLRRHAVGDLSGVLLSVKLIRKPKLMMGALMAMHISSLWTQGCVQHGPFDDPSGTPGGYRVRDCMSQNVQVRLLRVRQWTVLSLPLSL